MSIAISALATAVLSAPAAALECHKWKHVNCNVVAPPQDPPVTCPTDTSYSCLTVQFTGAAVRQTYVGALDGDPTDVATEGVACVADEDFDGQPITDKCEWYRTTGGVPAANAYVVAPASDFVCVETQTSLDNPELPVGDALGASTVYASVSCQASRSFSSKFQAQFDGLTDTLLTATAKGNLQADLAAHYLDREEPTTYNDASPVYTFPAATASMFLVEYVSAGATGTVSVTMTIPAGTVISDAQAAVMVGDLGNALKVHTHTNPSLRTHDHSSFGYTVASGTTPTCQTIDGLASGCPPTSGGSRPAVPTMLTALAAMFAAALFC